MGSFPSDLQREIRLREKVHFGRVSRMMRGFWAIWRRTVLAVSLRSGGGFRPNVLAILHDTIQGCY